MTKKEEIVQIDLDILKLERRKREIMDSLDESNEDDFAFKFQIFVKSCNNIDSYITRNPILREVFDCYDGMRGTFNFIDMCEDDLFFLLEPEEWKEWAKEYSEYAKEEDHDKWRKVAKELMKENIIGFQINW
jgi:hypothetical protein